MRTKLRNRLSRGFTLMEVVVFIVIVSIGLTAMMKVSDSALESGVDASNRVQATNIANEKMFDLMSLSLADLNSNFNKNGATQISTDAATNYQIILTLIPCGQCMEVKVGVSKGQHQIELKAIKY